LTILVFVVQRSPSRSPPHPPITGEQITPRPPMLGESKVPQTEGVRFDNLCAQCLKTLQIPLRRGKPRHLPLSRGGVRKQIQKIPHPVGKPPTLSFRVSVIGVKERVQMLSEALWRQRVRFDNFCLRLLAPFPALSHNFLEEIPVIIGHCVPCLYLSNLAGFLAHALTAVGIIQQRL
jgi:hypothetical protein